ncbi:MAG: hypothetical protein KDG50_07140 [Chromatiales bacterium]|nr:hypothetical protein [Chromatiales bacterium]
MAVQSHNLSGHGSPYHLFKVTTFVGNVVHVELIDDPSITGSFDVENGQYHCTDAGRHVFPVTQPIIDACRENTLSSWATDGFPHEFAALPLESKEAIYKGVRDLLAARRTTDGKGVPLPFTR